MASKRKFQVSDRTFKGRAPGRHGDWVLVILNTNPAIALAAWVIRSNKKGFMGLVVHSWTASLVQDVKPVDGCLTYEMSIPTTSILGVGALAVEPTDCRCSRLREEREWGDEDD